VAPRERVVRYNAWPMLQRAEALAVEVVHHPEPIDLRRRARQLLEVLVGHRPDSDAEAVGGGVLCRQSPTCAPQRLETEVGLLEVHLGAVHRDELLGAPLLVLEAAEADGARTQPEPAPDALHRL